MNRDYLYAGGAVVALVVGYFVFRKVSKGVGAAATAFNPASDKNLIYDFIGTDEDGDTLGTAIYGAVDTVKGWFGFSDADQQRKAEEAARNRGSNGGSYDYGTAGDPGIPWRLDAKPLPDPFNFDLGYLYR